MIADGHRGHAPLHACPPDATVASMMHEAHRHPSGNGTEPIALPPDGLVLRGASNVSRVRTWPSQPFTAHLLMYQQQRPPTADEIESWCAMLAGRGFRFVRTSALATAASLRVERAGFHVVQELVLLQHDAPGDAPSPGRRTSRLLAGHYATAARVDSAAFGPGWSLDGAAIADTCRATPRHRARSAGDLRAYAVTGRDARQGFLQRLAVHPDQQRQGLGRALALDSLRWSARWRANRVLVNTPNANAGALALYDSVGFHRLSDGLRVYERSLT
jgi:GNAT superfamily N-acetyltransferase